MPTKKKKNIQELTNPLDPYGQKTAPRIPTPPQEEAQIIGKKRPPQNIKKNPDGTYTVTVEGYEPEVLSPQEFAKYQKREKQQAEFGASLPEIEEKQRSQPGIVQALLNLTSNFRVGRPIQERIAQFANEIEQLFQKQPVPTTDEFGLTGEIGARVAQGAVKRGIQFGGVGAGAGLAGGPAAPITVPVGSAIGFAAGVTTGAIESVSSGLQADRNEAIRQSTQIMEKNNRFIQDTITAYQAGYIDETTAIANFQKAEQNYMQQRANLKAATVGYWGQDLSRGTAEEAKLNVIIDDILPLQKQRLYNAIVNPEAVNTNELANQEFALQSQLAEMPATEGV